MALVFDSIHCLKPTALFPLQIGSFPGHCYGPRIHIFGKGQKAVVKLPNGETLEAEVNTDSNLTKRLPADLSSPIGSRNLMLLVSLALESPLPDFHWVDGLPVSVRFRVSVL